MSDCSILVETNHKHKYKKYKNKNKHTYMYMYILKILLFCLLCNIALDSSYIRSIPNSRATDIL